MDNKLYTPQSSGHAKIKNLNWPIISLVVILHLGLLSWIILKINHKIAPHSKLAIIATYSPAHIGAWQRTAAAVNTGPNSLAPGQLRNIIIAKYGKSLHVGTAFKAYPGVTGFVVNPISSPQAQSILYANNQGHYFFTGNLLSANGDNISLQQSTRYIKNPMQLLIANKLMALPGIIQGNPAAMHRLTIVIDPNSPLFRLEYNNLRGEISPNGTPLENAFAIKWVLLDYLKPLGPHPAENILAAHNPAQALANWANPATHQPDIKTHTINHYRHNAAIQQLRYNWNTMLQMQLFQFPISVFKTKQHAYVVHGFVMDEIIEKAIKNMLK